MYCDILASHSPPHKILDKCYNGANAGCASLKGKVERMIAGPPKVSVSTYYFCLGKKGLYWNSFLK